MSSLMVDLAAPNSSQNSLRVWIQLGVSVNILVKAPRRSLRLILSMLGSLNSELFLDLFHYNSELLAFHLICAKSGKCPNF